MREHVLTVMCVLFLVASMGALFVMCSAILEADTRDAQKANQCTAWQQNGEAYSAPEASAPKRPIWVCVQRGEK